jgi:hypothetical protein
MKNAVYQTHVINKLKLIKSSFLVMILVSCSGQGEMRMGNKIPDRTLQDVKEGKRINRISISENYNP